jgi:hypothetical protein
LTCVIGGAGLAAPAAGQAGTAGPGDCHAINEGYLALLLPPKGTATRRVRLAKGDAVTLAAGSGGRGSVTLPSGERAPLAGTRKVFTASRSGDFAFRFAAEGAEAASFTGSCMPSAVRAARIRDELGDIDILIEQEAASSLVDPDPSAEPATAVSALDAAAASRQARAPVSAAPIIQWEGARKSNAPAGASPESEAALANLGVKLKMQPAIMVGVLAQFDQGEAPLLGPSDRNWLAGPVTSLQLGAGTSLDARAAWGPLEVDPAIEAHADRRTVDARLTNKQELGAWRLSPSVGMNFAQDRRQAVATGAEASSLHMTETGRLDVRPEIAYRIEMDHAMYVEPKVMVGPFWDLSDRYALGPASAGHVDARLKAETGITIGTTNGTKLQIGGGVEEGGPNALNVWSGKLRVDVPLK